MTLAALAALSIGGLNGQRERATSESMARVVAAEIEAARTQALKSGHPVAFCLPTNSGSTPTTQTFYILEGEVKPEITRVRSLAGDFPESTVAGVYWGSATLPSSATETAKGKLLAGWLGDKAGKDFALIFLPDGSVVSNDQPLVDGHFQILVSSGLEAGASNVGGTRLFTPSPNNFKLSAAFAPQTILVSSSGRVHHLAGAAGSTVLPAPPSSSPAVASLVPPAPEADTKPTLESIEVAPAPFLEPKATVQKERNLSLVARATDDDGDQLYCTWESVPKGSSPGTGFFSLADNHPMQWDAKGSVWVSNCTWAPPPECNVGDQYQLICHITDKDGNDVKAAETVLDPVTIIPPGKLVLDRVNPNAITVVNTDGTGLQTLTNTGNGAAVSPDGSQIAFGSKQGGSSYQHIYVMNVDGTGQRLLLDVTGNKSSAEWSGDGTFLLFSINSIPGRDTIWSVKANGTGAGNIYTGPGSSCYSPVFSPDGELVVYRAYKNAPGVSQVSTELGVAEFVKTGSSASFKDQSLVTDNSVDKINDAFVCWIPKTSREFIFTSAQPGPSGNYSDAIRQTHRARIVDTGTSGDTRFKIDILDSQSGTTVAYTPIFSPDGERLVYGTGGNVYIADWEDRGDASLHISNQRILSVPVGSAIVNVKAWIP